ncbi:hypothetical protein JCM18237_12680 [Halorubrum luteum]
MTQTESVSESGTEFKTGLEAWDEQIKNTLSYVVLDECEGQAGNYTMWDAWQDSMRRAKTVSHSREWENKAIEISSL